MPGNLRLPVRRPRTLRAPIGNVPIRPVPRCEEPRGRRAPRIALLLVLVLSSTPAVAHDASSWGGIFRTRDGGATWFPANPGLLVSSALGLAISPTDPHHLLLATDSGLLRSQNGGRDWELVAPTVLVGAVFAAAFDADGQRALVSTALALFRSDGGDGWRQIPTPAGATPARALVPASVAGRVYLAGGTGLARSDDWGASWSSVADGLPAAPVAALVAAPGAPETLYAIVDGRVWAGADGGRTWRLRSTGLPPVAMEALGWDPRDPARLWAAGGDRVFRSDDRGGRWQPVGRPLPERNTAVRGVTAAGPALVLTTDRGIYRSGDGGARWELVIDNVPVHLEAGPLVRDPVDPATLYAGFALIPYAELWRGAAGGGSALVLLDPISLAGAIVLLMLLALAAMIVLRRLAPSSRPAGDRGRAAPRTAAGRTGDMRP